MFCCVFFFKQKTAYEVRISDWSSDVCSSDLLVSGVLEDEGFSTRIAGNSCEALATLMDRRPSLVLLDVWLQGSKLDGLQLLDEIKRRDPTLPVLMLSGHGNLGTAVAALRQGAVRSEEHTADLQPLMRS